MLIEKKLDDILDTKSKVKIIRLFTSRREDFMTSGREIAKLVGLTPPAVHTVLKELYNQDILKRDIIGKQHIYRMNYASRLVKDILRPAFRKEHSIKDDISDFLCDKVKTYKLRGVVSLILYGSITKDKTRERSDCDIAIIAKDTRSKKLIEDTFIENISSEFYEYFTISLDAYIKTEKEFRDRLKKKLSPVSTLMKSYVVIYGKDPIGFK
jgi:predicted nucleotidyltransferase